MRKMMGAAAAMLCGAVAGGQDVPPTENHRADWFHDARWGVFTHYLASDATTVDDWNKAKIGRAHV